MLTEIYDCKLMSGDLLIEEEIIRASSEGVFYFNYF